MINKLIAKKRDNSSGVKPDPQEQLDVQMTPGREGAATVLESNPDFHRARLQDMMTPRTPTQQPAAPCAGKRSVLIGPGVEFDGSLENCDEVVIEGNVRATITAAHLLVKAAGTFSGSADVEKAEIEGDYEGTLTARSQLQIHQTGRVAGDINYVRLEIASGGILTGKVSERTEEEDKQTLEATPTQPEEGGTAPEEIHPDVKESMQ
jgi:cytoskeletal protein CcmA (bactofilin family)